MINTEILPCGVFWSEMHCSRLMRHLLVSEMSQNHEILLHVILFEMCKIPKHKKVIQKCPCDEKCHENVMKCDMDET